MDNEVDIKNSIINQILESMDASDQGIIMIQDIENKLEGMSIEELKDLLNTYSEPNKTQDELRR